MSVTSNLINILKEYKSNSISTIKTISNITKLFAPIRWVEFDFDDINSRPPKRDRYLVIRKDGKMHWELWNGNGWAYNHKVIRQWAKITSPYEMTHSNTEELDVSQDDFNQIKDLRKFFLAHPDKEMVKSSCLHFLGDKAQKLYQESPDEGITELFGNTCKVTRVGNTTIYDGSYGQNYVDNPVLKNPNDIFYTGCGATWDVDDNGNRYWKRYNSSSISNERYSHLSHGDIINEEARIKKIVRDVLKELNLIT